VGERVRPNDARSALLRFCNKKDRSEVFGEVPFTFTELFVADGFCIDKFFPFVMEKTSEPVTCKIRVLSTCVTLG
jgi:hypothetical protein